MRILRFEDERGDIRLGVEREGGTAEILEGNLYERPVPTGRAVRIRKLLSPLDPVNIFCIGLNYGEHAREANLAAPEDPVVFMKPTSTVTHPGDPIRIPSCCRRGPEVDYEGELVVVIGERARDVSEERALDHVLGYTAANDVSARRWQRNNGGQWVRGKSFDTFCPLGPAVTTAEEVGDPQTLALRTLLNGDLVQEGTTADMIFPVARLVSFLSQDTTLLPGTVILTGTPAGVGFARTPPLFLRSGDRVDVEIEKIGRLSNPVE